MARAEKEGPSRRDRAIGFLRLGLALAALTALVPLIDRWFLPRFVGAGLTFGGFLDRTFGRDVGGVIFTLFFIAGCALVGWSKSRQ